VEVPAAEAVRLMAGLHLGGVGELRRGGDKDERTRMRDLCGEIIQKWRQDGDRRACTCGAHLRQPVFRRDGSLYRCAKPPPVQLLGARGEETSEWRRRSIGGVADSGNNNNKENEFIVKSTN
jgi:hypothetical protein